MGADSFEESDPVCLIPLPPTRYDLPLPTTHYHLQASGSCSHPPLPTSHLHGRMSSVVGRFSETVRVSPRCSSPFTQSQSRAIPALFITIKASSPASSGSIRRQPCDSAWPSDSTAS